MMTKRLTALAILALLLALRLPAGAVGESEYIILPVSAHDEAIDGFAVSASGGEMCIRDRRKALPARAFGRGGGVRPGPGPLPCRPAADLLPEFLKLGLGDRRLLAVFHLETGGAAVDRLLGIGDADAVHRSLIGFGAALIRFCLLEIEVRRKPDRFQRGPEALFTGLRRLFVFFSSKHIRSPAYS